MKKKTGDDDGDDRVGDKARAPGADGRGDDDGGDDGAEGRPGHKGKK